MLKKVKMRAQKRYFVPGANMGEIELFLTKNAFILPTSISFLKTIAFWKNYLACSKI